MQPTENINDLFKSYVKSPKKKTLLNLLKQSQKYAFKICYQILKNTHDAEDATQDILIKILQNINTLEDNTKLTSWVHRISFNHAINLYHKRIKKELAENSSDEEQDKDESEISNFILMDQIAHLDDNDRDLITYRFFDQRTYPEIAKIMSSTATTVRRHSEQALENLKSLLIKGGFASVAYGYLGMLNEIQATSLTKDLTAQIPSEYFQISLSVKTSSLTKILINSKLILSTVAILLTVGASFVMIPKGSNNSEDFKTKKSFLNNRTLVHAKTNKKLVIQKPSLVKTEPKIPSKILKESTNKILSDHDEYEKAKRFVRKKLFLEIRFPEFKLEELPLSIECIYYSISSSNVDEIPIVRILNRKNREDSFYLGNFMIVGNVVKHKYKKRVDFRIPNFGYAKGVMIPKNSDFINVSLLSGISVDGIVSDESGNPIVGAKVTINKNLYSINSSNDTPTTKPVLSNEKGFFSINHLPPGNFILNVTFDKYLELKKAITIKHISSKQILLKMYKALSITGSIKNSENESIKDANFTLQGIKKIDPMELTKEKLLKIKTNQEGNFKVSAVRTGQYLLKLNLNNLKHEEMITVNSETIKKSFDIKVKNTSQIKGIALDVKGQPISDLELYLLPWKSTKSNTNPQVVKTSSDGSFKIIVSADKKYKLKLDNDSHYYFKKRIQVKAGSETVKLLLLKTPLISGSILSPSGEKLKKCSVFLKLSKKFSSRKIKNIYFNEGIFSFQMSNISYRFYKSKKIRLKLISKSPEFGICESLPFDVNENKVDGLLLQFTNLFSRKFKITSGDNKDFSSVEVLALKSTEDKYDHRYEKVVSVRLDKENCFRIQNLESADYDFYFFKKDQATVYKSMEIKNVNGEIPIHFTKGSTLSGVMRSQKGDVLKNQYIRLNKVDVKYISAVLGRTSIKTVMTDDNGKFSFNKVAPGEYRLYPEKEAPESLISEMLNFDLGLPLIINEDGDWTLDDVLISEKIKYETTVQVYLDNEFCEKKGKGILYELIDNIYYRIKVLNSIGHKGRFNLQPLKSGRYKLTILLASNLIKTTTPFEFNVNKNSKKEFDIHLSSDGYQSKINTHDGTSINGKILIFKKGVIGKKFSKVTLLNSYISSSIVKNNSFIVDDIKEEFVDVYFVSYSENHCSFYSKNISVDGIQSNEWQLKAPKSIKHKITIINSDGELLNKVNSLIIDDNGVPFISKKVIDSVLLPLDRKYTLYFSKKGYAVSKLIIKEISSKSFEVILEKGFEINLQITGEKGVPYSIDLLTRDHLKYVRPITKTELKRNLYGKNPGKISSAGNIKLKNITKGSYYLKVLNLNTNDSKTTSLIHLINGSVDIKINMK
ncbi:MAG: hypothetical protein COA79_25725 [Planctomycetota bacterium]|nr:MAG: hypothetical protein COA79_25725 [Planctomycetota bacterium]